MTTITGGGTGKARGGTGGTITGGRRVGTLRKKWKKGVCQVISEREEREEVTKGRQEVQRRGRVHVCGMWDVSVVHSSYTPGVFCTYFYNHAHRLHLEKLL